ncbi:MAG: CarD family transcriptional regulator [Alphaproteobacteria bacterium]
MKKAAATKAEPKKTVKKTAAKKAAAKKTATKKAASKKVDAKAALKASAEKNAPKKKAVNGPHGKKRKIHKPAPKPVKKAAAKPVASKKPLPKQKDGFKIKDFVVYPTHGVGQIVDIEESEVAGLSLQLFVIYFDQEKMTLRVPLAKAQATGMRPLSSPKVVAESLVVLKGRARIKRTMWSRRAQEYEAKINSGSIQFISEVVRDLYRAEGQPEQSYSERQLYEQALDRLTREVAAVEKASYEEALALVEKSLHKAPVVPPPAANDAAEGEPKAAAE